MAKFRIRIAGKVIEVNCVHPRTVFACKDYLTSSDSTDYVLSISQDDIDERRRIISYYTFGKTTCVKTDSTISIEQTILLNEIADLMLNFDTLLMHGAVVSYNGSAYMITAPSGTGKSTRARLWLDAFPGAIIVNGDKPLIKVTPDAVFACGTPWCGKEGWNTNVMVPLKAIFLLERADDNRKTSIEEISIGNAFPVLYQQTHRPIDAEKMRKTIELLKRLEGKLKIYRYRSTPTIDSVEQAFKAANNV